MRKPHHPMRLFLKSFSAIAFAVAAWIWVSTAWSMSLLLIGLAAFYAVEARNEFLIVQRLYESS